MGPWPSTPLTKDPDVIFFFFFLLFQAFCVPVDVFLHSLWLFLVALSVLLLHPSKHFVSVCAHLASLWVICASL